LELIVHLARESRTAGGPVTAARRGRAPDARDAIQARRWHMIFQQFLYPRTGCAAYVFG
jgi:hypothetical protein